MKILFITPRLPLPADTGAKIRTFNLLKHIAKGNKVTLLSFYFEENPRALEDLKNLGIEISLIKSKENINPFSILSRRPVSIEKYYLREMENKLKELVKSEDFDLAHFDHLHTGQYRESANGLPCVLDEHNIESLILDRCADAERSWLKKVIFKSQAKKMAALEGRITKKFSKCLTVSETDRENLSRLSGDGKNIEVIPNGVDTEYFNSPRIDEDRSLVFTGSMDWLPNDDAAVYFCREILPLIWLKDNRVKFYVVGRNPSRELLKLAQEDKRIVVTGAVDDIRPHVAKAKIFVVPLRIGGGTRLKILEAMSMSKVVVSTSIGAEGIDCIHDRNIIIADTPEEFANSINFLLNDESKIQMLAEASRKLVCNQYDWKIICERLQSIYQGIISEK